MKLEKLQALATLSKKDAFHTAAKAALVELATILELPKSSYDIRSNKGGFGVLGEVTLHGETIYVQCGSPYGILYRSCKGRKDCAGGVNQYVAWDRAGRLVENLRKMIPR